MLDQPRRPPIAGVTSGAIAPPCRGAIMAVGSADIGEVPPCLLRRFGVAAPAAGLGLGDCLVWAEADPRRGATASALLCPVHVMPIPLSTCRSTLSLEPSSRHYLRYRSLPGLSPEFGTHAKTPVRASRTCCWSRELSTQLPSLGLGAQILDAGETCPRRSRSRSTSGGLATVAASADTPVGDLESAVRYRRIRRR